MRVLISLTLIFTSILSSFCQSKNECLKSIKKEFNNNSLGVISKPIGVTKDTFRYNNGVLIVHTTNPEVLSIFKEGIVSPQNFGETDMNKLITISNVEELKISKSKKSRVFSFLLHRKRMLNPTLYIFEITNNKKIKNLLKFIETAKLTAFGICSILI